MDDMFFEPGQVKIQGIAVSVLKDLTSAASVIT